MTPEDGVLACAVAGGLTVCVEAERYRIAPGDVVGLIFSGRHRRSCRDAWPGRTTRMS